MFRVFLKPPALRDYKRLPNEVRALIDDALLGDFKENPLSSALNVKKLQAPFPGFRFRVGSYRVLFELEKDAVQIYSIKHRKDAYRE